MQQTLLALAALLAFSLYALARHQDADEVERNAISTEMSHAASELSRNILMGIEGLAYDEQSIGRTGMTRATPLAALGAEMDETNRSMFDDIDDYNGATWQAAVPRGADSLRFDVAVTVGFVQDANADLPSTSPTFSKEVRVHVQERIPQGAMRPRATASLRRVLTAAGQSMHH